MAFNPELSNWFPVQKFRFWCQKVLPLVYDDSLSYYELLCKVVDYLNKYGEDLGLLADDYKKLVEFVNNYFEQDLSPIIEQYVDEWLDEHPEATTTVVDGSLTESKFSNELKQKAIKEYVTPEMYGAVGDGVTDDTTALQNMFNDVISNAPSFVIAENHTVKDLSGTKFMFTKKYRITEPINISGVRGLVIDNLYLFATSYFNGNTMLSFGYDIRSSRIVNCTIDANHIADNCLAFTDYTLDVCVESCSILKFQKKGIFATGGGHELIINDCKVYQYEYAEWDNDELTKSENGIGIHFDGLRADNHINNCIVNYCVEYGLYIATGPNIITGCHIYSCPCYFGRNCVNVSDIYFDNSQAEIMGGASIRDSMFFIYGNTNAVKLVEPNSDKWRYESSWLTGNYFNNVDGVDTYSVAPVLINSGDYTVKDTQLAMYDNSSVLYATQDNKPSSIKRRTSADYLPKFEEGKITLGNYVIQWGFVESDSAVTFPTAYHYLAPIVIVNKYTGDTVVPFCNSVTLSGFWLGGTNGKKTQWVAIGRQGY